MTPAKLYFVATSGGWVAEAEGIAAGGSTKQAALAHLVRKLALAEGRELGDGLCPACYGDGEFYVRQIVRDWPPGTAVVYPPGHEARVRCEVCGSTGEDRIPDDYADWVAAREAHEAWEWDRGAA